MKHADSSETRTRRALLQSTLGAAALLAFPTRIMAATPPGFDEWRESVPLTCDGERHFGRDLATRHGDASSPT